MRVLIEESIHEAELGIAGGADAVILAYPEHLFALERERPYTHIYCRSEEAAQAVERLLPEAMRNGQDPGQTHLILYLDRPGYVAIEALYPLLINSRADDLSLIDAFQALIDGELDNLIAHETTGPLVALWGTDNAHIILGATPATTPPIYEGWMTELLPDGFMAQVEAATVELTQRYMQTGSIRDAIGAMGFDADEILGQVNSLFGFDAEAALAQTANYTNPPVVQVQPTKRPHFGPDQVRSYKELKYGHFYVLVDAHGRHHYIRFKRIEWRENGPVMICESAIQQYAGYGESYYFLGDSGLAPYADGIYRWWNPTNHVLRAPRKSRFVITQENGKIVKRQRRFYS